ncbi:hypothetical protein PPROV_000839300 [Pycnococcus provasolii]|uniref:FAD-dependent oxidoreductase 2 FAD binding domain-containing protein n=1 Tax=Pycnococcus provasolii TaxID=41880 RepID=A0A830HRQ8_9CHLO|nr:hypothetical protein PPROV_000839300 [Pycnococcus provasolii]
MSPLLRVRVSAAQRPRSSGSAYSNPPRAHARRGWSLAAAASSAASTWRIFDVKVDPDADPGKDYHGSSEPLMHALQKRLKAKKPLAHADVTVVRKSMDARRKENASFVYVVDVRTDALKACGVNVSRLRPGPRQQPLREETATPTSHRRDHAEAPIPFRVVVVGAGPAGLFAALELAEAGASVRLLERGKGVEKRGASIGALFARRVLDNESNLCYGEGGAGTWSDGKLTTRIGRNAAPVRKVLDALVRFGAPERILTSGAPHLGTDNLVRLLRAFRAHLQSLGCSVEFDTKVDSLVVEGGRCTGVRLHNGDVMEADAVVLAPGHSARALYEGLAACGVELRPKPFAMGFRVEHPQDVVDRAQYGEQLAMQVDRGRGKVPVASYSLAAKVADSSGIDRSVYSFCMCPGGQVVPTSVREDELCVNGMSFSRRGSPWANSALVCEVTPEDWAPFEGKHGALAGVALQKDAERRAAALGGGNMVAPAQRLVDFVAGKGPSDTLPRTSYRLGVKAADMADIYPAPLTAALRAAATQFAKHLDGFLCEEAVLIGAETRTSAPVWIERDRTTLMSVVDGLFPCGEGAGHAGGIVSAAVDGVNAGAAAMAWFSAEKACKKTKTIGV